MSEFEIGDIVIAQKNGQLDIDTIGEIIKVYAPSPMSSVKDPTYRVELFSTSNLHRNTWENYYPHEIKKLSAKEVYHLLSVQQKMRNFKSMKDGVI